jgi:hypothetical protein
VLGVDLTQIPGLGPSLVLKLVGECGTDLSPWPDAKHFTSWLCLAPSKQDFRWEGPVVPYATFGKSGGRIAATGRGDGRPYTDRIGAFYRRLLARIGKAKAVTATARKIARLFYTAVRHGMVYADPGALLRRTIQSSGSGKPSPSCHELGLRSPGGTLLGIDSQEGCGHLLGTAEMRFRLIEDHRDIWPVRGMCPVLGLSVSGYYAWRSRIESPPAVANQVLLRTSGGSMAKAPAPMARRGCAAAAAELAVPGSSG